MGGGSEALKKALTDILTFPNEKRVLLSIMWSVKQYALYPMDMVFLYGKDMVSPHPYHIEISYVHQIQVSIWCQTIS